LPKTRELDMFEGSIVEEKNPNYRENKISLFVLNDSRAD